MHATAAVARPRSQATLTDRYFYGAMGVACIAIVFVGFARTYFLRFYFLKGNADGRTIYPLLHLHAAINLAWLFLFFSQAALIAARRTEVHKKLGVAAGLVASLVVVLGVMTALHDARGAIAQPFLTLPLGDMLVFCSFTAAGFFFRQTPEVHKRLMLLGTVGGLMGAPIKRLPFVLGSDWRAMLLIALSLAAAPVYDRISRGRVSSLNFWGGVLIFLSIPARYAMARTDLWHRFALWLVR